MTYEGPKCCRCGMTLEDGAYLERVNAKGEVGIWKCARECGYVWLSEEDKIIDAIKEDW